MRRQDTRSNLGRAAIGSALIAATLLVPATPAAAADAVDQMYTANTDIGFPVFIHDRIVAAQTFTAGVTGSLNRIDLAVGRIDAAGTLQITIVPATGGTPGSAVLASATLSASAVDDDGFVHDVSVALPPSLATAGSQYAVVLAAPSATEDTAWFWATDSTNGYAAGQAFDGDTVLGTFTAVPTDDRTFATNVDSTPCAVGAFSVTGFGPCSASTPGHFVATTGATSQAPCALGTYQPNAGSVACIPAPIGSYVDSIGATVATPCPAGTTTSATGSTSAALCQANTPPPTIACTATPSVLWPPNNKLANISVAVTTAHATGYRLVSATADEGVASDIAGWTVGAADTAGQLRASRDGSGDGRTYSLVYEATNATGATADCTAIVSVPHDQGHN